MTSSQEITSVLVTGGSGFLGAHIVQQLLDNPAISVAIVSRTPKETVTGNDRVSYHSTDIAEQEQVQAIFDKISPQVVIHTVSPRITDTAAALERTNVQGTKILLQCAKECGETRAFIYTSSDSAVVPTQEPVTEDKAELYTESHFKNHYGRSKAIADALVQRANSVDLSTAVIRVPGIYGEHDTNLVPQLLSSVRKNEHKIQIGSNDKPFEFVYVQKAAEAHILAARALLNPASAPGVAGEAFFISDGKPEFFFDFTRRCYAATGNPVDPKDVTVIPLAAMQAMASIGEWAYKIFTFGTITPKLHRDSIDYLGGSCCWSIEKARQRLGYEPVTDQDAAIKRTMEWALANL
jgi:sterol-4alpha-carboxylate 3-dehydrogenase (decarboxylating)